MLRPISPMVMHPSNGDQYNILLTIGKQATELTKLDRQRTPPIGLGMVVGCFVEFQVKFSAASQYTQ
jgi:hypothetical protein